MVAVDEERKPVVIPSLSPDTPDGLRRQRQGQQRRQIRHELQQRYEALNQAEA